MVHWIPVSLAEPRPLVDVLISYQVEPPITAVDMAYRKPDGSWHRTGTELHQPLAPTHWMPLPPPAAEEAGALGAPREVDHYTIHCLSKRIRETAKLLHARYSHGTARALATQHLVTAALTAQPGEERQAVEVAATALVKEVRTRVQQREQIA